MAILQRPLQLYPVGSYGPLSLAGVPAGVQQLRLKLGNTAAWPTANPLFQVDLAWNEGGGASFVISSPPRLRSGAIAPEVILTVDTPKDMNGDGQVVTGGTVAFQVFTAFSTNLTLETI